MGLMCCTITTGWRCSVLTLCASLEKFKCQLLALCQVRWVEGNFCQWVKDNLHVIMFLQSSAENSLTNQKPELNVRMNSFNGVVFFSLIIAVALLPGASWLFLSWAGESNCYDRVCVMIWSCDFIFWAERSIQSSSEGRPECRMQYHCHGTDKSQCTEVSASSLPVSVAGVGRASDPFLPFPVSVWTYGIPTAVTSLFILTLAWRTKPLSETPSSVRVGVLRRLPSPHFLSRKGVTLRLDSSKFIKVIYCNIQVKYCWCFLADHYPLWPSSVPGVCRWNPSAGLQTQSFRPEADHTDGGSWRRPAAEHEIIQKIKLTYSMVSN